MAEIKLHNSATRRKEPFVPIDPHNIRIYVCGPTVYDRAHLGNARPVVVFDVLFRLLRHVFGSGHVTYVRNITDIDDKINARASETGRPIREITAQTAAWFLEDMAALGAMEPSHMPRATEYVPRMVEMIGKLIETGHAYEVQAHVLFAVESYPEYGRLSGRSVEDMIAGARVEVAPYKRNPMDFVLWKPSTPDLPGWDSPWGRGRPGWHIECSAMVHEILGDSFDIHGGGNDLQFPHHENEIAQSRCAHPEGAFARVWMHNEMLRVEGRKMAKSLGNFLTVRDLLDRGVSGEVIRFVLLSTHYRRPMDWTERKRQDAEKRIDFLEHALDVVLEQCGRAPRPSGNCGDIPPETEHCLADDLNTHGAIVSLEAHAARLLDAGQGTAPVLEAMAKDSSPERLAREFVTGLDVLGLYDLLLDRRSRRTGARSQLDEWHRIFVQQYRRAKETRDFEKVDIMKRELIAAGVEVRMGKEGIDLVPGPDFDHARLEDCRNREHWHG